MADYFTGNAIPAPSISSGGKIIDQELLFSTQGFTQKGVTLKPGQGVLKLGTALKRDATSKQYVLADDGTDAEGILRQTVDTGTDADGKSWNGNIVISGLLKFPLVEAANEDIADLTTILGGVVNENIGYFKI